MPRRSGLAERGVEPLGEERFAAAVAQQGAGAVGDEHADSALLVQDAFVDELGKGLGGGRGVDAVGRRVLGGGHGLVAFVQGAGQDLCADRLGDLHVDGFASVEHRPPRFVG